MVVREMTEQECRAVLARTHVVRLACARNNQPYIVPIHVDLDGPDLYGYSTQGQKIDWMRENPLVCLEADELTSQTVWASVVVTGRYEELPNVPEYEDLRREAERLFQRHPMWWEPAAVPVEGREYRTPVVFRIRIARLTGRRGSGDVIKVSHILPVSPAAGRPGWLTHALQLCRGGREAGETSAPSEERRPEHQPE